MAAAEPDPEATSVGDYAFYGCSGLETALIGSKVNEIGGGAFGGCSKLKSITVEAGNENYTTVDGMLLTYDHTTLISGAGDDKDVTIPNGVTRVDEGAFSGFDNIQSIYLPSTVTTVGDAAFSNCTALVKARIPSSVTSIGANAFYGTALAKVVKVDDDTTIEGLVAGTGYDTEGVVFEKPCTMDGANKAVVTDTSWAVEIPAGATTVEVAITDEGATFVSETPLTLPTLSTSGNVTVYATDKDGVQIAGDNKVDITRAFKVTPGEGNTYKLELDEEKVAPEVDTESETPVSFEDDSGEGDPGPAFTVKVIPGLWYAVEVSESPADGFSVDSGTITQAPKDSSSSKLPNAPAPTSNVMYYRISVGASKSALEK